MHFVVHIAVTRFLLTPFEGTGNCSLWLTDKCHLSTYSLHVTSSPECFLSDCLHFESCYYLLTLQHSPQVKTADSDQQTRPQSPAHAVTKNSVNNAQKCLWCELLPS